ncbi:MAG: type II toxin-antitoxin system RelE/ParE family toxin [Bacteroidota bacterium]|jgi:phage-related protein
MNDKSIEILFLQQAEDFLDKIEKPVRKKFFVSFHKTKSRIFGEWFKKMSSTDNLFEFRVDYMGRFYRLFAFWDSRDLRQTLVVCTHGLIKKSKRTPKHDIKKAEEIKANYFEGLR